MGTNNHVVLEDTATGKYLARVEPTDFRYDNRGDGIDRFRTEAFPGILDAARTHFGVDITPTWVDDENDNMLYYEPYLPWVVPESGSRYADDDRDTLILSRSSSTAGAPPMRITVRPTFPHSRRNSPSPETLCSDLVGVTTLPPALLIADEAGITVSTSTGWTSTVRALIGVGPDDQFSASVTLICRLPDDSGPLVGSHRMNLKGTVGEAIDACALDVAVHLGDVLRDERDSSSKKRELFELVLLDHLGNVEFETTC